MSHVLIRTSPKGEDQLFVGRCPKCGATGLRPSQIDDFCPGEQPGDDVETDLLFAMEDPDNA